jgi:hypothetical protein
MLLNTLFYLLVSVGMCALMVSYPWLLVLVEVTKSSRSSFATGMESNRIGWIFIVNYTGINDNLTILKYSIDDHAVGAYNGL